MEERQYIDLHVHSNVSDGTLSPSKLVKLADNMKLYAFALTDHDCVDGILEAINCSRNYNVMVIPGIEVTTKYLNEDAHILGYNINYLNSDLINTCNYLQEVRNQRNLNIIKKMNEMNFFIDGDSFMENHKNTSITRMHYAKYMFEQGYVSNTNEAFKKYLGNGGPLDIPREKITPKIAIDAIHNAGGKAVLAHPVLYKWHKYILCEGITDLKNQGIDGIEAIYSRNSASDTIALTNLAKRLNLFITGGSDFHGDNKPDISLGTGTGNLKISKALLKNIYEL